ncbi:response regulator [Galbitalea soli]|uniref:response regulator n=1 Tax=Galbitalea soli TaxID=1268042 RepID=UPI0015CC8A32|nr:two-component system KDP operon response regulator KdpE [Galbitalea soli]
MDRPTTLLLVEDDRNIIDLVQSNLLIRGFEVVTSRDGSNVLELLAVHQPDVALVDLMLPGVNGFDVCRALRERDSLGIIVVSARGAETDKVRALNLGADDYLTKPFGIDELLARINATLRRSRPSLADVNRDQPMMRIGDVTIDFQSQLVMKQGSQVKLTPTEWALLRELAQPAGALHTHAALLRKVWGPGYAANTEYVRVYIGRLRAKLESAGDRPLIVTEPRAGYRLLSV